MYFFFNQIIFPSLVSDTNVLQHIFLQIITKYLYTLKISHAAKNVYRRQDYYVLFTERIFFSN